MPDVKHALLLNIELFNVYMFDGLTIAFPVPITPITHNLIPVGDFLVRIPRVGIFRVAALFLPALVRVVVFTLFTPLKVAGNPIGRVVGAHVHGVVRPQAGPHLVYVTVVPGVVVPYLDAGLLGRMVRVACVRCHAAGENGER